MLHWGSLIMELTMPAILGGGSPCQQTPPQRVQKRGHLFIGMTPMLKTVSNLSLGFPECGMTNASNFTQGFPLPATPKGWEKGEFIFMGMMPRLKTVSNLPSGSPEYNRTSACNFRWGLPPASNLKGLEKGHSFNGMTRWIKTVIDAASSYMKPCCKSTAGQHVLSWPGIVWWRCVPVVVNKTPWYSTSTSHLGTRQVPLTSVLDKYLSPRYSTSTSHLGTRQVPLTSVLDKYLSPRYSTSTSHHWLDSEWKLRRSGYHHTFIIIGPDQTQR